MLQLTAQSKIMVCIHPVDFRKGVDTLAALCREQFKTDPHSGCLFVFCNRRKTSVKILSYDGQGFWLCQKRLSKGKFNWWPKAGATQGSVSSRQLQIMLWNGNPVQANLQEDWRKLDAS